jgi:hypothetical protein
MPQDNPNWDHSPDDRVPIDQTVAIRIKHQEKIVRRKMLSKCPQCHQNFPESEPRTHREQCSGGMPVLHSSPSPASEHTSPKSSTERLREAIDHNLPRTAICKKCQELVKRDPILMRNHLKENHPLLPAKKLSRHFKM